MIAQEVKDLKEGDYVTVIEHNYQYGGAFLLNHVYRIGGTFIRHKKPYIDDYSLEKIDENAMDNFIAVEKDSKGITNNAWNHKFFRMATLTEIILYGSN